MRNFSIIIIALLCVSTELNAQIKMAINDVTLYNIKVVVHKGEIIEGELASPSINGKLCIANYSENPILLEQDKFMVFFNYKGLTYKRDVSVKNIKKAIMPCDTIFLDFKCNLVRFTSIQKEQEYGLHRKNYVIDYTIELLELLPTLKIRYRDSLNEYWAIGIENVSIEENIITE